MHGLILPPDTYQAEIDLTPCRFHHSLATVLATLDSISTSSSLPEQVTYAPLWFGRKPGSATVVLIQTPSPNLHLGNRGNSASYTRQSANVLATTDSDRICVSEITTAYIELHHDTTTLPRSTTRRELQFRVKYSLLCSEPARGGPVARFAITCAAPWSGLCSSLDRNKRTWVIIVPSDSIYLPAIHPTKSLSHVFLHVFFYVYYISCVAPRPK